MEASIYHSHKRIQMRGVQVIVIVSVKRDREIRTSTNTYPRTRIQASRASAMKQMDFFHQSGGSGVLILGEPLRRQLSSEALLSRKLVHSGGRGRELKPQSQMIEHASDIGLLIPAFDFAGDYF
jgi:hypothetical protein